MDARSTSSMGRVAAGLGLLCAAVLVFQVALTRIFSFVTWYHLTFLAISLALLGFGASGTYLAEALLIFPSSSPSPPPAV